jgi:Domain of unknown function (DUF4397)
MKIRRRMCWLSAALGSLALTGCGSANPPPAPDDNVNPPSRVPSQGGGHGGGGGESGSTLPKGPATHLRIAHLSPGAPAVDVCIAPRGTTGFVGPVLAAAGLSSGLAYGQVTAYLTVPANTYDVRIVSPGASDCVSSLAGLPDVTNLPSLSAGGSVTLAAEGTLSGSEPFGIAAYVDETTTPKGEAKLRFVHASPGTPAVDVGVGAGVLFTSVFTNVSFGGIATSGVDADGYLETPPLSGATLSARPHATLDDVLAIDPASLPAGAIATAFAIGEIGSKTTPLRVLLCVDNAPENGALASCSVVGQAPALGFARIAHLSPDAPNVDICLRTAGAAAFTGKPLFASLGAKGISYPQVSTYVPLPEGAYDVRITATEDCSAGAVPDTLGVVVPLGIHATVAALGDLAPVGADAAFQLKVFADDVAPETGVGLLRFIHASPGTPAVGFELHHGVVETTVFSDVSFGEVGQDPLADPNGYLPTSPFTDDTITAIVEATHQTALHIPNVSLATGSIVTSFAIGGKTGDATNPLQVLVCADSAPAKGFFTSCSALSGS